MQRQAPVLVPVGTKEKNKYRATAEEPNPGPYGYR